MKRTMTVLAALMLALSGGLTACGSSSSSSTVSTARATAPASSQQVQLTPGQWQMQDTWMAITPYLRQIFIGNKNHDGALAGFDLLRWINKHTAAYNAKVWSWRNQ